MPLSGSFGDHATNQRSKMGLGYRDRVKPGAGAFCFVPRGLGGGKRHRKVSKPVLNSPGRTAFSVRGLFDRGQI